MKDEVAEAMLQLQIERPNGAWAEARSRASRAQRRGDRKAKELWTAVAFRLVEQLAVRDRRHLPRAIEDQVERATIALEARFGNAALQEASRRSTDAQNDGNDILHRFWTGVAEALQVLASASASTADDTSVEWYVSVDHPGQT